MVANWSPQDYEIFTLNEKVRSDLGPGVTFYSWLGLSKGPKSTVDEISKAYRKLSRKLHPDKYRGKLKSERKKAEERFQRLSLVGNILRDHALRQRYDYFIDKGFPKWKGTGYYYLRFRPGIFLTLFMLYVVVSAFQYVSMRISRRQDRNRILSLKNELKHLAWGGSYIPPLDGSARKVQSAIGKDFHVSPTGDVSLIEYDENGEMTLTLMDENDINANPGLRESYFFLLPCGLWNITVGKLTGYTINTETTYVNPNRKEPPKEKSKKKKSAQKGEKVELPNGKVMYKRRKN